MSPPAAGPGRRVCRIRRNLSTSRSRAWWADALRVAAIVRTWPDWKRAGINVAERRTK